MKFTLKRSLALLFVSLVLKHDQAQSFQVGGISATRESMFARSKPLARNDPMATSPRKSDTQLNAIIDIVGVSPEPIHTAFAFATFGPQPFWLLMILLPGNELTKKIMGKMDVVIFFALLHFFIVSASIAQPDSTAPLLEFNDVFDPAKDSQAAFMNMVTNYPNFVAEEWPHVLTWDLFVGRYIWLDGLKRGIFTSHSVLFSNLIGPPGLLLHWVTCLVTGKGFGGENEALEEE
mmetsp:Transcript_21758/g.53954  ORF Transcript_21758/g.53954 Transcript_21758/m.53954 type:complete len:234 (+) Transcript_21758:111-812(+)|eukprot:CAMPEP_0116097592 /NCGR_PEP_ID=MMETSP0327-20121206/10788_1 /TAXON_ID=44447 /ORGANISM="Pseudo-nitzschia delicatissima, Strain B596" /LENGTH=233 /DNA_ID=CAMNT_0003589355 /DNA_START=33 /DNA_END=734 /DNA_ORIENTATION=+